MRVLVVATNPQFTAGTHLMATLAAALAARGDVVALATALGSETEQTVERAWPRLSVRSVTGRDWWRQAIGVRRIVTALRPDALLVGSQSDAVLAAFAAGKSRGIVRRFATDERPAGATGPHDGSRDVAAEADQDWSWSARFALSRARISNWGADRLAIGWPEGDQTGHAVDRDGPEAGLHRLPVVSPEIALMPGPEHDERTAQALRVLAHVRSRHPHLRVLLLGDAPSLQATRLHAAALDLATAMHIESPSALLQHALPQLAAVWVTATGDAGAIASLAAMQQRVPVVVPGEAVFAELVTPGVTGWHVSPDAGTRVAAELSRVLGDAPTRQAMGDAAAVRAMREYRWDAFVDAAAAALRQSAALAGGRVARRPSRTPR